MKMLPEDCSNGKWRAAFDTLRQCIEFFADTDATTAPEITTTTTTTTSEGVSHHQHDPEWLDELKETLNESVDETKIDIFVNMTVVV